MPVQDIPGAVTPTGYVLPAIVPATDVPETYSSNDLLVFVGPAEGGILLPVEVAGPATVTASGATTLSLTATSTTPVRLSKGQVLDINGVPVVVDAAAVLNNGAATNVTVLATTAEIPANSKFYYTDYPRFPLAEDSTFTPKDTTETVNLYGASFPFSSKNMMDADASLKSIAGIKNPVIADLVEASRRLGGRARRGVVFVYPDGNVIFAGLTIGAGFAPTTQVGNAQRYTFPGKLAGEIYTMNLNDAVPAWELVQ